MARSAAGENARHADIVARLARRMPRLFHMTEAGSADLIRRDGLWPTSELLDRCGLPAERRTAIEAARRARPVALPGGAVIRDNGVLDEAKLRGVLTDGLTPEDWYRLLNAHVFFWPSARAMAGLLTARAYRGAEHDVLELDAATLLADHAPSVRLTCINTGATGRTTPRRGPGTFLPLDRWPPSSGDPLWTTPAGTIRPIREVAILGGVEDVAPYLLRIARQRAGETERVLWERP